MKKYIQAILPILFFCLQLAATETVGSKESFLFLNLDQFQNLTAQEQKLYIRTLQNVVVQFEQAEDTSPQVQNFLRKYKMMMSLIPRAQAADDVGSSKIRSADTRIENAKIDTVLLQLKAAIRASKDKSVEVRRQLVADYFMDSLERLELLSRRKMNSVDRTNFAENVRNLNRQYDEALATSPQLHNIKSDLRKLVVKIEKIPVLSENSPATKKSKEAGYEPRCLYSGFVIVESKCVAVSVLPDANRLQELGKSEFKCKSSNEILCNPLVFGYQADLSPYCTTRSATASKACKEISNNTENLARLHSAWVNPANHQIFYDFQQTLNSLCDSKNKSKDVTSTCKVVISQFNETVKKEFPAQLAAGSASSKTYRSSKAN